MDEDAALLEAWRAGDARAGSSLLGRRVGELTWFFRNKVFEEADVPDLVSQTFLGCVQSKERFRGDTSFRRFVYAIAQNVLREYLRAKTKHGREQLDFSQVCVRELDPRSLSSIQTHKWELQALVEGLREVPLGDQVVLELKYFEGLSGSELAALLDVPEGTVRSRLRRALDRLREKVRARTQLGGTHVDAPTLDDIEVWAEELRTECRGAG